MLERLCGGYFGTFNWILLTENNGIAFFSLETATTISSISFASILLSVKLILSLKNCAISLKFPWCILWCLHLYIFLQFLWLFYDIYIMTRFYWSIKFLYSVKTKANDVITRTIRGKVSNNRRKVVSYPSLLTSLHCHSVMLSDL